MINSAAVLTIAAGFCIIPHAKKYKNVIFQETRECFGIVPGDPLLILGNQKTLHHLATQIFQFAEKED